MAEHSTNGKPPGAGPGPRRILAPHLWPHPPLTPSGGGGAPLAYVSWAGWELYLTRKLGLGPELKSGFYPLFLPDLVDPERDCLAIDQLAQTVGELGAGVLALIRRVPESVPGLAAAIGRYREATGEAGPGPILDDRSYLALWSINEFRAWQSYRLLAETKAREKAMWAALKGEEEALPPLRDMIEPPAPEPDSRTDYAWTSWLRLTADLIGPDDVIIPGAPRLR